MAVSMTETEQSITLVMTLSMAVLDEAVTRVDEFTDQIKPKEVRISHNRWVRRRKQFFCSFVSVMMLDGPTCRTGERHFTASAKDSYRSVRGSDAAGGCKVVDSGAVGDSRA
ncbi:hypothetical protein J6590_044415 [Homalodisca vitripennis]|nr:hypothetical protein J6590_044415 [Homalodisca vitripennis]